ncbi:MAG: hypothetical protein M1834_005632 [Cirrosporium novae-zelandiae]|nr:MAG: hypothetical protein M1834_005632 [Cirrosporium novae-zelandiae]
MSNEDSLSLMKTRLSDDKYIETDALKLLKELRYLPLAITHASSYIDVNKHTMTISKYISYLKNEANQKHLLTKEQRDLRRDNATPNAIITTLSISFKQIRDQNPRAAEVLSLMSIFDRQGIPEFLVRDD